MKVTNKHNAPLLIAGVTVAAGATVERTEDQMNKWANGNAAKVWLEQEIVTVDGSVKAEEGGEKKGGKKAKAEAKAKADADAEAAAKSSPPAATLPTA